MRRIPIDAPQDKRNALMLETVLFIAGAAALSMAVVSHVTKGAAGRDEALGALAIAVFAWSCVHLSRRGYFRLSASLTVIGGLALIWLSYATYGLQAQSSVQMTHLMPLLFAGLLLGRAAVWWAALANAIALAIGAWVDMAHATNAAAASAVLPNLFLSAMNFLVLAVILDRLILSSQRAIQRSVELEIEIEQKELAYARLLQTQRMEAIGRLSTGVAHDFNNILSVILGLATSSRHRGSVDTILPGIRQAARRGAMITRRLLSFSRTQVRQVSTFDLAAAVDEARTLILPMFSRNIEVRLNIPHPGPLIRADRDELELTLLNIVGNACDAMPKGGRFGLSIESSGDHALISIEDTGVGMTPDVLARLFEPFFTTKPKEKGTGIGMAIVHRFVADSRGKMDVDSAPGQGTRIRIRLPLAVQEDETLHEVGAQGLRILLVGGDPELSQLATTTLATHGYSLVQIANADEAISHALQSVAFDVVIANHAIPGADAPTLLREMGRMLPKARLALISEHGSENLDDPDMHQLRKPFTGEQLLEILRTAEADQDPSRAAG
jgi:signal transduction histidine kinase/CheY-like chemotaxis protein